MSPCFNPAVPVMELFCPACQAAYTGLNRCPRCGGPVLRPDEVTAAPGGWARPRPSLAGRVAVGLGVGLGVFVGLAEVAAGLREALDLDTAGRAVVAGLAAAGVWAGGVVGGAGRRGGLAAGAAVGVVGGGLLAGADVLAGGEPGPTAVALPAALAAVGGLAGLAGGRVWPAPPELDLPAPEPQRSSGIELTDGPADPGRRTTAWARVLVGGAVLFAGVLAADPGRVWVQKATGGRLRVETRGEGRLMSTALAVLAGLAGGTLAAAGTGTGLRHGGLAGVLGAAAVVGAMAANGTASVPASFLLDRLGMAADDPPGLAAVGVVTAAVGLAGGWFGGVLFPPLAPRSMWYSRVKTGGD